MVQLCRDASPYAFGSGVLFNLLNLALVGFLVFRQSVHRRLVGETLAA